MSDMSRQARPLLAGGLAAVLASACCVGPLLLVSLGLTGAWIGNLQALDPLRPLFLAIAAVALFLAGRRIYRAPAACEPGEACAIPRIRRAYKAVFWLVAVLVLVAFGFPYVAPLFY